MVTSISMGRDSLGFVDLTNADIRKFIPEKALKDAQVVVVKLRVHLFAFLVK